MTIKNLNRSVDNNFLWGGGGGGGGELLIMTNVSAYKMYIDSTKGYKMEDTKRQEIKSRLLIK